MSTPTNETPAVQAPCSAPTDTEIRSKFAEMSDAARRKAGFRKVVASERDEHGRLYETMECGHIHQSGRKVAEDWQPCLTCKFGPPEPNARPVRDGA